MGTVKFEEDKITLTYLDGVVEVYKVTNSPIYKVGMVFIDHNGKRFFNSK